MGEEKRVAIERWFVKADRDLKVAHASLQLDPPLTDMACFHAQQCAGKSLKAFLVFKDRHVEKTHDLLKIVGECVKIDPSFEPFRATLKGMSRYAAEERYPDDWREIPLTEAEEALK